MPSNSSFKAEEALERVQKIEVQGVRVLDLNFSRATPDQTLAILEEFRHTLTGAEKGSVRVLSGIEEMIYDAGVSSKWKAIRMEFDAIVRASAVYGASSFMCVAVQSYMDLMSWLKLPYPKDRIRIFKTREQALAWLVKT